MNPTNSFLICNESPVGSHNESRVGSHNESRVGSHNESRVGSHNESRVGGACGPPPPFVAPLVPRCALTSGATPRDVLAAAFGSANAQRQVVTPRLCHHVRWHGAHATISPPGALARCSTRRAPSTRSWSRVQRATERNDANDARSKTVRPESDGRSHVSRAAQHVAGGRPGSECAARHERSNERGRGAAGSPDPALVHASRAAGSPDPALVHASRAAGSPDPDLVRMPYHVGSPDPALVHARNADGN
jgi:hypothetical protein